MNNAELEAFYDRTMKEMRELANGKYDTEVGHSEADKLLVELLNAFGFEELTKLYDEVPKWYA